MTNLSIARRYACALLDVAIAEGDPVEIGRQLAEVTAMIDGHGELRRALVNPAVPTLRKRAAVSALVAALDGSGTALHAPVEKLLLLLADRDRFGLLGELRDAYAERVLAHQEIVRASVTTAAPLSTDRAKALQDGLSRATGKHVTLDRQVDPAILGGVVARIGSMVYDGSVTRQLERLKRTLVEG